MEVFVGEVCIPKYGFVPVFTSSEHKVLDERDISRFSSMLKASGIKGLYVSDGAKLYYRMCTSTIIAFSGRVEVKPLPDLLTEFEEYDGDICSFLRELKLVSLVVDVSGKGKMYSVIPAVALYSDEYWENVSLAPVKLVLSGKLYISKKHNMGVIKISSPASFKRSCMPEILKNPTSKILAERCGIELSKVIEDKKQPKEATAKRSILRGAM